MHTFLDHVGLSVTDLERSIDFYCGNFDFELVRVIEIEGEKTVKLGKITGMGSCRGRIAHLKSGRMMLELFEYTNPRGKHIRKDAIQADIGFIHIGFITDDIFNDVTRLEEKDVRFISEPVEFRPGVWVVYFYGPDGEVCELRQLPEG